MELSYAAYNYPEGGKLPWIPRAFMGNVNEPVTKVFERFGFSDYEDYNYQLDNFGAHVIAHRNIEITEGEDNNVYGNNLERDASYSNLDSNIKYDNLYNVSSGTRSSGDDVQVTNDENVSTRSLIVIAVRGSVIITVTLYFLP